MTFVERHVFVLTAAVAGMILLRMFDLVNLQALGSQFRDQGFLQWPQFISLREGGQNQLASMITNVLQRKRSASPVPFGDEALITGSTSSSAPEKAKEEKTPEAAKPAVPPPAIEQHDAAEKSILEKLGLRRTELEKREEELANREALLQAAEKRLADRTAELKRLEDDLKATAEAQNAERQSLKPIVVMYETMKPKDAARLFEKLDPKVLMPLAAAMNPRKLADVLAQLDPVLASSVTKSLSGVSKEARLVNGRPAPDLQNELPDYGTQGSQ